MIEMIFLLGLALIWIIFATVQDLRTREVANWLTFSLIIFALGFRFFFCLFAGEGDFSFFYQGLIWLGILVVIGNLFYAMHLFAGGDAKLLMALGPVLSLSNNFMINLYIWSSFLVIFLVVGAVYGLLFSFYLTLKNLNAFKKEFKKQWKNYKKFVMGIMILGLIFMVLGLIDSLFFVSGVLIFVLPYLYVYAKAIEEACMVKKVKASELTVGDWLYEDIKIGKRVIKADWNGLSSENIKVLRARKKFVMIKQGIAFVPVFLISYLIISYLVLWNPLW